MQSVKQILSANDESLRDAQLFTIDVLFTTRKFPHFGGVCRKLDDLFRFIADKDFVIVITQEAWDNYTFDEKMELLIHELHHVRDGRNEKDLENGLAPKPRTRRHNSQDHFCELPEDDKYSGDTLGRIRTKLGWKKAVEV